MNASSGVGTEDTSWGADESRSDGLPRSMSEQQDFLVDDSTTYSTEGYFNYHYGSIDPSVLLPELDMTDAELEVLAQLGNTANSLAVGGDDGLTPAQFSPTQVSQEAHVSQEEAHVVAAHVGPPSPHPARPRSSRRGTKWTSEMDAFFMQRKNKGETYTVISRKMKSKFRVSVNPNILSKRFRIIAKEKSKDAIIPKALSNAIPRLIGVVEDAVRNACAKYGGSPNELIEEMHAQLQEWFDDLALTMWRHTQARGA